MPTSRPQGIAIRLTARRPSGSNSLITRAGLFEHLAAEPDNEYALIDTTIVRAHQHSASAPKKDYDQAIGRCKGGLSAKIHALVDTLGNQLRFLLIPGQAHSAASLHATIRPRGIPRRSPPRPYNLAYFDERP